MNLQSSLDGFFVKDVLLKDARLEGSSIRIKYDIDGFADDVLLEYDSINPARLGDEQLKKYMACLGVFGFFTYGAVLPQRFDISPLQEFINPKIADFVKKHVKDNWSEHRYQVGRMDYNGPEMIYDEGALGKEGSWPIFAKDTDSEKALLTSGAGKDSLLNALILDEAGIEYEIVTYLHNYYGRLDSQKTLYDGAFSIMRDKKQHTVSITNKYYPWLRKRMEEYDISKTAAESRQKNTRFRAEAGEVYFGSMSFIPIHILGGMRIQLLGNEKSADEPNLKDDASGEYVYHQWIKSFESERLMNGLFTEMANVTRASVLKPIHDVRIFQLLFEKAKDSVYSTYSCNIVKPWCNKCEKCAYVFAGFAAFGDMDKTINAFGQDLFKKPDLDMIWRELLGLKGHIPFECVGHPQEAGLYLYMAMKKGARGPAIEIFKNEVLKEQKDPEKYYADVLEKFGRVYDEHHMMPPNIWEKIRKAL